MFWDDLRRLLGGRALYRLDGLLAVRLVPILYALGLAAIALWSIDHLVASFAESFSQGLWGVLEIIVFAPLSLVALRIVSETVLVFFKAHEAAAGAVDRGRRGNTLLEDVSDAIHDLAEDDELPPAVAPAPLSDGPAAPGKVDVDPIIKGTVRGAVKPPPAKT